MKCPVCGGAELVHDTRDIEYTYKGESTILQAVTGDFCPDCHESVHDREQCIRLNDLMLEFNKQVNSSIFDPDLVTRVRKKLKLDQKEAAALFGGGINAFSRYENGKTKPPVSLVRLLQLLDRHPELLLEIKKDLAAEQNGR